MEILDEYSTRLEKAAARLHNSNYLKSELYGELPVKVQRVLDEDIENIKEEWRSAIQEALARYNEGQLDLVEFGDLFYAAAKILSSDYHY